MDIKNSESNCKLTKWEYTEGVFYGMKTVEQKKAVIDAYLKKSRILVHLHITDKNLKEFFEENYELYGLVEIPIGYNKGYQYHIFIRNNIGVPNPNMRETEYKKPKDKKEIKEKFTKIFKDKRRKSDIIDELLAEI